MQPDVSIIIAAFNAEATLAGAIRSALGQREIAVEILVVNDASDDRTAEIAHSFLDASVKLIDLAKNRGPGGARNVGLDQAQGNWIAVLDSDDTMQPDRLVRMVERAKRDDAQAVVDNLFVAERDQARHEMMFSPPDLAKLGQLTLADFIRSNRIFKAKYNFGYMKPVFQRSFLEAHGLRYDENLRIGEDYLFLAAALAKGARCAVEPQAGYVYNVCGGSISRVLEMRHVEAMLAADAGFEQAYDLDSAARQALRERSRSLRQAASFLSVVHHLKEKALLKAARIAVRDPAALRYLRMPIGVRLRRMAAQLSWGNSQGHGEVQS
ncbi:glycosyltransferase family 2 protein [Chelativorans xinjiangense]|uniref:glycosyltransferase family 2 protein n=1 Tax=Chelativorans xinjiangense TaxID=2681485 RepID=UPI001356F80A|nr:glycosyltransferase family 2 protein [Chelativorans xinjiangense]